MKFHITLATCAILFVGSIVATLVSTIHSINDSIRISDAQYREAMQTEHDIDCHIAQRNLKRGYTLVYHDDFRTVERVSVPKTQLQAIVHLKCNTN